jgi:protocatechuate 3,4-dioxygenase beta subunit
MTTSHRRIAAGLVAITLVFAVSGTAAGQAPGLPDPARLPSRPGMPGPSPGARPGAPPRDSSARPAPATGTGVIRGRVLGADTGLPLRRARVMLRPQAGNGEGKMTLTDADGTFAFTGLPAGRYDVHGSKPRYVDMSLGSRGPNRPGRPVDLAEGQTIESLALTLPAAGVITGRVFDDAGDVVPGAHVMAMRYRSVNGERHLMPMGRSAQADDTGTFRLYGLAPGTYYVSIRAEEGFGRFGGAELADANVTGFALTYFPGTTVAEQAQPVEVVAGAEVLADVTLAFTRLTSVTGIVLDASGAPATGGHIMTGGGRNRFYFGGGSGGQIKQDGTFTLSGMAPGEYVLQARATFGEPRMFDDARPEQVRLATAPVSVAGEPVTGVRLIVQPPLRVPVTTTFEDAGPRPERIFVSAVANDINGDSARVGEDGRLTLEVPPGAYRLTAATGPPWLLKRLLYRGREVAPGDEVELTAEPGGRIDVVFTSKAATLTGAVTDRSGRPISDYTVIVLPQSSDQAKRNPFQYMNMARADQQGRFRVERMPAGAYVATAIEDFDMETLQEPEVQEALRRAGRSFRAVEGETVAIALTLAPLP